MRTSTRRRLDGAALAGCSLLVGVAGAAGAAFGDQERVVDMWVRADVAADGSAQVTEVIDYEFGGVAIDKHGLLRIVEDLPLSAPVTVSSETAPDDLLVTSDVGGTKLRVGDPNRSVSGRHRYRLDYPLPGVVQESRLDWDAVGTAWKVGIENAEIHLLTPFELRDLRCFAGKAGSDTTCDDVRTVEPGHIVVTVDGLSAGAGVSIEAETGSAVSVPPADPQPPASMRDDPGTGILLPGVVVAAASALAAVPAVFAVRRAGRERVAAGGAADAAWASGEPVGVMRVDQSELAEMATTEFAPPGDLEPPHGGIVLTEHVRPEHKVAWLIDAAIEGAVELVEEDGRVVKLVRTAPGSPQTAAVLDRAFGGRDEISLGSYDSRFGSAWSQLGRQLDAWRKGSGLWDHAAEQRRVVALVLGIVGAVVGVGVAALGGALAGRLGGAGFLALAAAGGALAGVGLAAALTGWELRVRTPSGSAAWLRVESFRRFLAGSEAYHAEEAAKRGVLREYTAWAVAIGEIDRWARAVRASTVIPSEAGISYAYVAPALMASTSATATAPSSSGSGGGGGSVGGGAGGGGGGSW